MTMLANGRIPCRRRRTPSSNEFADSSPATHTQQRFPAPAVTALVITGIQLSTSALLCCVMVLTVLMWESDSEKYNGVSPETRQENLELLADAVWVTIGLGCIALLAMVHLVFIALRYRWARIAALLFVVASLFATVAAIVNGVPIPTGLLLAQVVVEAGKICSLAAPPVWRRFRRNADRVVPDAEPGA